MVGEGGDLLLRQVFKVVSRPLAGRLAPLASDRPDADRRRCIIDCDVALIGGTTPEHYRDSQSILDFEFSPEEMLVLDTVSAPAPIYPTNFLDLFCCKDSEFYGGLRVQK